MQQIEELRDRIGDQASATGKWLRVGIVSTTVVAPLIARWNDLRAASRNVRLREEAEARLEEMRALVANSRGAEALRQLAPQLAPTILGAGQRSKSRLERRSTRLWLLGVGIGLAAAGTGAFIYARRRAAPAENVLVELPIREAGANGARTNGMREPSGHAEMMAAPSRGVADAADALYVGNIHTMVYHEAADVDHLPAEENRVYFLNADEAREAGYRRDRDEIPPAAVDSRNAEGPGA